MAAYVGGTGAVVILMKCPLAKPYHELSASKASRPWQIKDFC